MDRTINLEGEIPTAQVNCDNCGRIIGNGWIFAFKVKGLSGATGQAAEVIKCFFCALRHRPMVRRSIAAAVVVGTVLTLLNQGDTLVAGNLTNALFWKIPLTYCVPFIVATYGALTNNLK
ncbi:MAG: hypothetical protein BZY88_03140 [SAR202 cluster bacterium Io17-Chloro-G9]|nr:MAG: hypothetical protein BZY88_03140 [SAR202 cluster bacterium Io17-Chloro-G9]